MRYGNLGRNTFRGPWFHGLNSALLKNFKLRESVTLQFRAEAINILNHANFDNFITNVASSSFGRPTILVGDSISRNVQFGARLTF